MTAGFDAEVSPIPDRSRDLTVDDIVPFLLLTFALSWGLVALMIAWPERVEAILGEIGLTNPAYLLAVWAPAPVAFALRSTTMDRFFPHNVGTIDRALRVTAGLVLLSLVFFGPQMLWGLVSCGTS